MAPPKDFKEALERLEEKDQEIQRLRAELALIRQGLFGRKRERIDPNQLHLFEDNSPEEPEEEVVEIPARKVKRRKKGHGRSPLPDHLPREVIEVDVPESERTCSECCGEMQRIGEEITERAHIVPVKLVVKRYVRPKYACPQGHAVKTAQLPDGVIDGGKYEASVYGHLVAAKYQDHMPLSRLEGIFKRYGAPIAKQTMWDLILRVDELVAEPILAQMRSELLKELVLHADESPVTVRTEGEKTTRTGYVWLWRSLRTAEVEKVLVDFRNSRSRAGPSAFLGSWTGTLITDGYSGYDEVTRSNGLRRAGCWAHARRKLKNALDTGAKDAVRPLRMVQRLFWIERAILSRVEDRRMSVDELYELRRDVRARRSHGLTQKLSTEVGRLERKRSVLPKSELGKALGYLTNQWLPLTAFLKDARAPIHNNDAERELRHIVTGRKNWLVFGSERGGAAAARLFSLVLSCTRNGVDPEEYITDVLGRISTTPHSQIASLTPWGWKQARVAEAAAAS